MVLMGDGWVMVGARKNERKDGWASPRVDRGSSVHANAMYSQSVFKAWQWI